MIGPAGDGRKDAYRIPLLECSGILSFDIDPVDQHELSHLLRNLELLDQSGYRQAVLDLNGGSAALGVRWKKLFQGGKQLNLNLQLTLLLLCEFERDRRLLFFMHSHVLFCLA